MILDRFDQEVLSASGNAADFMREFYGKRIGENNARKYRTGIITHLKMKQRMKETKGRLNEKVVLGNGQITTKRMMLLSESDSNDKIRIMQLNGYDPLKWELVSCKTKRNDWDVTMKMKEYSQTKGKGASSTSWSEKHTNHQYKIELTVKPIQEMVTTDYIVDVLSGLEVPKITEIKYADGNLMFELPIMDFHFSKLAWAEETGDDYDLKIAETLYKATVLDFLSEIKERKFKIELIVFPIGQDFFHFDNSDNKTTAGTALDVDSRWQKMYRKGVELLIWAIEQLRQIAPVQVVNVPGNHDYVLSYCAVVTVNAYYKDCESVTVSLSPTERKYIRYGVNLIGFSHGKEGKRIEHLMQQEKPEDWGETMYREWHLGDLHHEEAKEIGGVKIRRLSSITARDAWHAKKGYCAVRMAQAFLWDKERGKRYTLDSNVIIDKNGVSC